MSIIDSPARKLRVREAAIFLGVSKSFLDKKRLTGGGPIFLKMAPRLVAYDLRDLEAWAARSKRRHTSDAT